jgi:putative transcriptional regulator
MTQADNDFTGRLLIAMPGMEDPRFEHSVVYMCSHSDEGAMGLIVNKTAPDVDFKDLMEQLKLTPAFAFDGIEVHYGGPVERGRGFVLHSPDYHSGKGTMRVADSISMTATLDVLEDIVEFRGPQRSLFALGYAGWGPGQLESEIAANGWLTAEANDEILFGSANNKKWTAALKQIGIDSLLLSAAAGRA